MNIEGLTVGPVVVPMVYSPPAKPEESEVEGHTATFGRLTASDGCRRLARVVYYALELISALFTKIAESLSKTGEALRSCLGVLTVFDIYNNIHDLIFARKSWQHAASCAAALGATVVEGVLFMEKLNWFNLSDVAGTIGCIPVLGGLSSLFDFSTGAFGMWHDINEVSRIGDELDQARIEVVKAEAELEHAKKLQNSVDEVLKPYGALVAKRVNRSELLDDQIKMIFGNAVAAEANAVVMNVEGAAEKDAQKIEYLTLKYTHKFETIQQAIAKGEEQKSFVWVCIAADIAKWSFNIICVVGFCGVSALSGGTVPMLSISLGVFSISLYRVYRTYKFSKYEENHPKVIPHPRLLTYSMQLQQNVMPIAVGS